MAGTAYHMETLRKARVIERKTDAMRRIQDGIGQDFGEREVFNTNTAPLVFSEQGHYEQKREIDLSPPPQTAHKKTRRELPPMRRHPTPESMKRIPKDQVDASAERIRHRRCRAENEGKDNVKPIMNPPEYNFQTPIHALPPRKPHFKV